MREEALEKSTITPQHWEKRGKSKSTQGYNNTTEGTRKKNMPTILESDSMIAIRSGACVQITQAFVAVPAITGKEWPEVSHFSGPVLYKVLSSAGTNSSETTSKPGKTPGWQNRLQNIAIGVNAGVGFWYFSLFCIPRITHTHKHTWGKSERPLPPCPWCRNFDYKFWLRLFGLNLNLIGKMYATRMGEILHRKRLFVMLLWW